MKHLIYFVCVFFVALPSLTLNAEDLMLDSTIPATEYSADNSASSEGQVNIDLEAKKRLEAAVAYEKVTPIKDNVMATFDELKNLPQFGGENNDLLDKLIENYNMELVRNESIRLMAAHFTVEEINALTEFYKTSVGKSIYKKMPKYMADFMPIMQNEMSAAIMVGMRDAMEKMNQDIDAIRQENEEKE